MVRIAKPAFVSVFLVLTLLATMLTPVLGKGDGVEEIIARLQTAKDPAVAFLKLDSSQRQVVQEYLTLATVVDGASAPVADAAEGMAAAAGGCWTWTWNRQGRNILGVVLWQFRSIGAVTPRL